MPEMLWRSLHVPPRWTDRVAAHPETVLAVVSVAVGALVLVGAGDDLLDCGRAWAVAALVTGSLKIVAACLVIFGNLSGNCPDRRLRWTAAGWAGMAVSWAGFVALGVGRGVPVEMIVLGAGMAGYAVLRVLLLQLTARYAHLVVEARHRIDDAQDEAHE